MAVPDRWTDPEHEGHEAPGQPCSSWTRRRILAEGVKLALVVPPLGWGLGCADPCADPDLLSTGQASLRASMNYAERSPYGPIECMGCEFFKGGNSVDGAACGTCQLFKWPVHSGGYCAAWSPRKAGTG